MEEHEIALSWLVASMLVGALHFGFDAAGSVLIITFPESSVATHSLAEAHETASSLTLEGGSMVSLVHVGVAAVGSVEIAT